MQITKREADEFLAQLDRIEQGRFKLEEAAFQQQLAFIEDPARLKALFCTRRAAKSYTAGLYLLREALAHPGCNCLFIGLTRQSAHGIIWKDILRELDTKYRLNIKFNETLLTATLPNGSVIWVTGADTDEQEMNKLLGKKYRLVCIDEASMFTVNMHQLTYGVLKPATADQRGTICLLGTSSNITRGLFYDITTGREPGWALHQWTAFDNPHVARQWRDEIDEIKQKRPNFMETALYRQWYLNEWVVDEDALVYKFNEQRNLAPYLPQYDTPYHYVLGVDLGHSPDPSAFVVGAFHDLSPILYIVHAEKHLQMDVTDVANKIKALHTTYNFDVKVIDNANKQAVAELNNRHGTNILPADKTGKNDFINLMNAELIQGMIKLLPKAKELGSEYQSLVWETDNGKVKEPRKEHPSLPNHLCFIAGTKIETWLGSMLIEDITIDDYVLTRRGLRKVERCGTSGIEEVCDLLFSDGTQITCTLDHPFLTDKGFVSAKDLTETHQFTTLDKCKQNMMALFGVYGAAKNTYGRRLKESLGTFINGFGSRLTALFLEDGTFIIKTTIISTIILRTLNALEGMTMTLSIERKGVLGVIQRRISSCLRKSGLLQRNGTPQKRVLNGIRNMLKHGEKRIERRQKPFVRSAEKTICEMHLQKAQGLFVPDIASMSPDSDLEKTTLIGNANGVTESSVQTNTSRKFSAPALVARKIRTQKEKVFNLEVHGAHEYFANGFLVSNCDASLYLWRYCYQYLWKPIEAPLDRQLQSVWEPKHIEKLAEQIQQEQNPQNFDLQFQPDPDLFDFDQDDAI